MTVSDLSSGLNFAQSHTFPDPVTPFGFVPKLGFDTSFDLAIFPCGVELVDGAVDLLVVHNAPDVPFACVRTAVVDEHEEAH